MNKITLLLTICILSISIRVSADIYDVRAQTAISRTEAATAANAGNMELAISELQKIVDTYRANKLENTEDFTALLSNLAMWNYSEGNLRRAADLYREDLDIILALQGRIGNSYMVTASNLVQVYSDLEEADKALPLALELLELVAQSEGKDNQSYLKMLDAVIGCYADLAMPKEALEATTRALELSRRVYGDDSVEFAEYLSMASMYNSVANNYKEAIRLQTKATELIGKLMSTGSLEYARHLSLLATHYNSNGDLGQAEELALQVYSIMQKGETVDLSICMFSLPVLAQIYVNKGEEYKAYQILSEIENLLEREKPGDSRSKVAYASLLATMGMVYQRLGNLDAALQAQQRCLDMYKGEEDKRRVEHASIFGNMASIYIEMGEYDKALLLQTKALDLKKDIVGKNNIKVAKAMYNLALIHAYLNHIEEALQLTEEAHAIIGTIKGTDNSDYAIGLFYLATYKMKKGDYSAAEVDTERALAIMADLYGSENQDVLAMKETLMSAIYLRCEDDKRIPVLVSEIQEGRQAWLKNVFRGIDGKLRESIWQKTQNWYFESLPMLASFNGEEYAAEAYNGALLGKGLLLSTGREFERLIKESGDEESLNLLREMKSTLSMRDAELGRPISGRIHDVDSLNRRASGLERQLLEKSTVFGDFTRGMDIDWLQVQSSLKPGEMAVEFQSFTISGNSPDVCYSALVVTPKCKRPVMVKLFKKSDLQKARGKGRKHLDKFYKKLGQGIWKPILAQMPEAKTVYFAAAGELHAIPIEYACPEPEVELKRVSSTRILASRPESKPLQKAAVYGGIQYGESQNGARGMAGYLPGTATEAEQINKMLTAKGITTMLFTGPHGSESSFKQLSGQGLNLLHLGTHGFFYTRNEAEVMQSPLFMPIEEDGVTMVEDRSLSRSGLLMAGCNALDENNNSDRNGRNTRSNGFDDGVLTGLELSRLDFRDLDLATLSACQTGLGDIFPEGVFGLQRAFKIAGANTLLMSLWSVDDRATSLLMQQFYANLLKGNSKSEALRHAQDYLRNLHCHNPEEPDYSAPYYWAAFILLDDI